MAKVGENDFGLGEMLKELPRLMVLGSQPIDEPRRKIINGVMYVTVEAFVK